MSSSDNAKPSSWVLVAVIVFTVIGVFLAWKFLLSEPSHSNIVEMTNKPIAIEEPLAIVPTINEQTHQSSEDFQLNEPVEVEIPPQEIIQPVEVQIDIPKLDESDSWVKENLSSIIWRKELLELLIDEDMIRRFVVFVDNFSQGNVAYSHSPFIKPATPFKGKEGKTSDQTTKDEIKQWEFDEASFKRFSLYVDLFRAADAETLVGWYKELTPLINQAYSELGYPDKEFPQVLELAIAKVLDLEFTKENHQLIRPSVMYQYKSAEIEMLDDADKLMLRIGKDNLLIIKSVLLEINEKISNTTSIK